MKQRLALFIPLAIFAVLSVFFFRGLSIDPTELPSALIDKPLPEFQLPNLHKPEETIAREDVVGDYLLVNIWATWCAACKVEHPFLVELAEAGMPILGVNWKDNINLAKDELIKTGNPFFANVIDAEGRLAFDLGVYGAPETFLVNPEGMIVYKHVGILDQAIWTEKFLPLMQTNPS